MAQMSLSLLNQNVCSFQSCGLHFQTLYDLIAHIEFAHIPLLEDENRKKALSASASPEENRITVAANMPLSCFQRVYPTPYRPIPCPLQPVKVSFNHYRRRQMSVVNVGNVLSSPANGIFHGVVKKDEDRTSSVEKDDIDECAPNDPEMRYRCNWIDCGKRFKNGNGLRLHMRNVHNSSIGAEEVPQHHNSNASSSDLSAVSSPTKYAQSRPHKCNQCSKRYKTTQGLQNHVSQAHQKVNGADIPDSNAPSPAALAQLILQKTQGQAQQIVAERPNYQQQNQRPLPPVSFSLQNNAAQTSHNAGHLPVRSFPTQQNRPQPFPVQTTGQMLKHQINRNMHGSSHSHQQLGPNSLQQPSNLPLNHPGEYPPMHQHQSGQRIMVDETDVRSRYPATIHQINNGEGPKHMNVAEHEKIL